MTKRVKMSWMPKLELPSAIPQQQQAYLEHRSGKRSIRSTYPQDIDQAARRECAHSLVLVGEEVLAREFLRNMRQRLLVGLLLFHVSQLHGESLQPPQQLAGRNGLAGAP